MRARRTAIRKLKILTDLPTGTSLHQDRRGFYLGGEAEDERVDEALTDVRPLEDARAEDPDLEKLRERVERLEEAAGVDER
ncbi:hypothetical protein [Halorubrum halophilum]|uniref:hypothetical protein n=1 Tax=Halorubrum halophilum TaxID=413816 RepID=UPI000679360F|nr:hypothetical protein [Halorubrum halophilum]